MATVVFDSGDAFYGLGVYNQAVYGSTGPVVSIEGFGTTSFLGSVVTKIGLNLTGLSPDPLSSFIGDTSETGDATHTVPSNSLTVSLGDTTETGVVFNFEAVKERYDRKRTVIISTKRTTSFDRTTEVA